MLSIEFGLQAKPSILYRGFVTLAAPRDNYYYYCDRRRGYYNFFMACYVYSEKVIFLHGLICLHALCRQPSAPCVGFILPIDLLSVLSILPQVSASCWLYSIFRFSKLFSLGPISGSCASTQRSYYLLHFVQGDVVPIENVI